MFLTKYGFLSMMTDYLAFIGCHFRQDWHTKPSSSDYYQCQPRPDLRPHSTVFYIRLSSFTIVIINPTVVVFRVLYSDTRPRYYWNNNFISFLQQLIKQLFLHIYNPMIVLVLVFSVESPQLKSHTDRYTVVSLLDDLTRFVIKI